MMHRLGACNQNATDLRVRETRPSLRFILLTVMAIEFLLFCCGCSLFRSQEERATDASIQSRLKEYFQGNEPLISKRLQAPPSSKAWRADLAILPFAEFTDNDVVIHDVRNCRYRSESDYDVRHYDLKFPLDEVKTVDFIVVPFKDAPILAHTMLSFGLKDGRHFCISVEARLEEGESYSPSAGSLRRYELAYIIGDENDLIPLRTEVRNVDVYLYAANATPDQVQDLLVDMLARANKLYREPEYYDTITNNCTTNIVDHINRLKPGRVRMDPRVLLPGHSDRLAYELGLLKVEGSFEDLRVRSRINVLAAIYRDDPQFSQKIRGL